MTETFLNMLSQINVCKLQKAQILKVKMWRLGMRDISQHLHSDIENGIILEVPLPTSSVLTPSYTCLFLMQAHVYPVGSGHSSNY